MTTPAIEVFADAEALAEAAALRLGARVRDLQSLDRIPRVLLTGGSIAQSVYARIRPDTANWAAAAFWFGDERFLPANHPERNDTQARAAFLDRVGARQVHAVPDNDCSLGAADAARAYADDLPASFDVALFGVGPDGHVASLFPGFPQLHESAPTAAVFDAPKPPPVRVTLTFPALRACASAWFLVSGSDKADAVARALATDGTVDVTPARGVRGVTETCWLLDEAAASRL